MADDEIFRALSEAFEAAAASLRQRAALIESRKRTASPSPLSALDRARAMHPQLGQRQAEAIQLLDEAGPEGTNTGAMARTMSYDQPNIYTALKALIKRGFVEKDVTTQPHIYRLSPKLRKGDTP